MLPESLLRFSTSHGKIVPHYLDERDHSWLRLLWDEYLRFVGRPHRELFEHVNSHLPFSSPAGKRRMVTHLLGSVFQAKVQSPVPPAELRARLFIARAKSELPRNEICARVASEFGIVAEQLDKSLFADLPGQRCLTPPSQELSPGEMALLTNLNLVQGLLAHARSVQITLEGNCAAVVRQAKRKGLICLVEAQDVSRGAKLAISGPYSLFRCTLVYGHALAELVPVLPLCNRFELRAECILGNRSNEIHLRSGDPIFPFSTPTRFDSKLEERFCRAFQRASKHWDVIREPEPFESSGTLIFPDFALQHRTEPERRWLLEIIGYWTPDYLRKKLERLKKAGIGNLILCISDKLNCSGDELPEGAAVVRFQNRIDPADILRVIGE